ncbi:hypothetical protein TRFO_08348 [Tritrichomonas foetus]|uniref:Uncharacterized protein n=1 Tax=Tritrichomonas foetus TaxID=1144522 RepID=A0A1J4JJU2_9EUKA|nr:hypothetical protein TRFO_08348 [Tritrichomonas foetus]|eukprot:OHS99430.1 hypothetical protein TRFO_08348 [Tritrichomonas foetus]
MLLVFLSFFIFQTIAQPKSDLPFDDDDVEVPGQNDEFPDDDQSKPTPAPHPTINPENIRTKSFIEIIQFREIFVLFIFIVYIAFYVYGRKSVKQTIEKAISGPVNALKKYYKVVPSRLTASSLHRYDSFSTGRTTHLGCLTTLSLSRRCDILGYLYDRFQKERSTLSFEAIIEQPQNLPIIFHISESEPTFKKQFALLTYPINDKTGKLKCFTDFEEATEYFIPEINEFIEKHPGLISLIEISDANRFELRTECRFVVRVEFNIHGFEDVVFSDEVTDFTMKLADKYATLEVPKDVLERMQRARTAVLQEQKAKFEKEESKKKNE